jgi:molybdate-binding protein
MHWGPENEAHRRHPSLLQQYSGHQKWVLIRAFKREQGLIARVDEDATPQSSAQFFNTDVRWSVRQQGSGTQRFLLEELSRHGLNADSLNITAFTLSEREAAAAVVSGRADVAPATRAIAGEFGLRFISFGWQAVDFVIPRNIWFRHLFQNLLKRLQSDKGQKTALELGGYDLAECGEMVWCED